MKFSESDKERLTAILNDPVFKKATDSVLIENRLRTRADTESNASAHCFNEGMIQFVEKMNELVGSTQQATPRPRALRQ